MYYHIFSHGFIYDIHCHQFLLIFKIHRKCQFVASGSANTNCFHVFHFKYRNYFFLDLPNKTIYENWCCANYDESMYILKVPNRKSDIQVFKLVLLQAEDFHQKGQGLLDWLASAERQLRYRGALPEEELPLLKQIEEHKVMSKVLIYM